MEWDDYFIKIAEQIKFKSKDINTKIGVVIVGMDNEIVSTGYNSFPRGIDDYSSIRQERPEKYYWFSHAETNAIINCARIGVSTKGTRMYMSCPMPCADCARNIINAGIIEIICKRDINIMNDKWVKSSERSIQMLKEAGVKIKYYD
jgi:dCMP deaminase